MTYADPKLHYPIQITDDSNDPNFSQIISYEYEIFMLILIGSTKNHDRISMIGTSNHG